MAIPESTQRRALETIADGALESLRRARDSGDELGAELAEHELNRALDELGPRYTAKRGPGARESTPGGRRAASRPESSGRRK